MTDLVPVITPAVTTPVVVVKRDARTVRLGDLGIAPENLRFNEPPDDDIPTLAATIRAAGQLQPLTVRPGRGKKEEAWMALDGRRRRLALGLLLEAGEIDADHPVDVFVETDPARQAAAVLLTNTAVPVHVADVRRRVPSTRRRNRPKNRARRGLFSTTAQVSRLPWLPGLDALRMRPDRIVVGEMREGAAALETLKSWNTGHPGGLSTIHANSAEDVLRRVEDLVMEVVARAPRRAISQAVDRIVHIRRTPEGRRVEAVLSVDGLDGEDYCVTVLA